MSKQDKFTRTWIIENALTVIPRYDRGVLTLRAMHYQLVGLGMTNTTRHYKRVVAAMIQARREGIVDYSAFSDHERETLGRTDFQPSDLEEKIESAKNTIEYWMENYYLNTWENQPITPEIWIEKKALQGVFQVVCRRKGVALAPCKGYPSLTFLRDAAERFQDMKDSDKTPLILYFGDYDASGEDIPRSIQENLLNDFGVAVEVRRISLLEEQVVEWQLPHAPTKTTDSRAANWDGFGQVELDAVEPDKLQRLCRNAIDEVFDKALHKKLKERETEEKETYVSEIKEYVSNL